jgi:hypothetical protein
MEAIDLVTLLLQRFASFRVVKLKDGLFLRMTTRTSALSRQENRAGISRAL